MQRLVKLFGVYGGVIALQSLLQCTCIVLGFFILNLISGERLAAQGPFVAARTKVPLKGCIFHAVAITVILRAL